MASIPPDGSSNAKWIKLYRQHCLLAENSNAKILITGDSLIAGLSRYSHVWERILPYLIRLILELEKTVLKTLFGVLKIFRHPINSKICNNLMRD